jgi:hypothetical protein
MDCATLWTHVCENEPFAAQGKNRTTLLLAPVSGASRAGLKRKLLKESRPRGRGLRALRSERDIFATVPFAVHVAPSPEALSRKLQHHYATNHIILTLTLFQIPLILLVHQHT